MDTLLDLNLATRSGRVGCFVNVGWHNRSYPRDLLARRRAGIGCVCYFRSLGAGGCGRDVLRFGIEPLASKFCFDLRLELMSQR
jgi:hypothetical protein